MMSLQAAYSKLHTALFFNDSMPPEIYTLSLHDALPICGPSGTAPGRPPVISSVSGRSSAIATRYRAGADHRSEEHTSELQSQFHLVCRLLLEKKKRT